MTDLHTLQHCRQTLEAAGYSVKSPEPNPEVVTYEDYAEACKTLEWMVYHHSRDGYDSRYHTALRNAAVARWIRERTRPNGIDVEIPDLKNPGDTWIVPASDLLRFFAVPPEER